MWIIKSSLHQPENTKTPLKYFQNPKEKLSVPAIEGDYLRNKKSFIIRGLLLYTSMKL
jgi:hypothetical protein